MIGPNVVLLEHVLLSLYAAIIIELTTQLLSANYFMLFVAPYVVSASHSRFFFAFRTDDVT